MSKFDKVPENPSIDAFVECSFDISDRLFEVMKKRGISQKDLAEILGKNESEISKWLSGVHNFTIKTIKHIEVLLNASIIQVVKEEPETVDFDFKSMSLKNSLYDCLECVSDVKTPFIKDSFNLHKREYTTAE